MTEAAREIQGGETGTLHQLKVDPAKVVGVDVDKGSKRRKDKAKKATAYVRSKDLAKIGELLIKQNAPLRHLANAKIAFVMTTAPAVGGGCWNGVGKLARFPRTMTWAAKQDFYLIVSEGQWTALEGDKIRRTFLYHLLKHAGQDNQMRWHTKGHDFEEFVDVAKSKDQPEFWDQMRLALQ